MSKVLKLLVITALLFGCFSKLEAQNVSIMLNKLDVTSVDFAAIWQTSREFCRYLFLRPV